MLSDFRLRFADVEVYEQLELPTHVLHCPSEICKNVFEIQRKYIDKHWWNSDAAASARNKQGYTG